MDETAYRRGLAVLFLANAAHSWSITSIFSYVGYLAVDCGWAENEDRAGAVAGVIASAMPFGRVFTSSLWGAVSDRIGNRRALILSMLSVAAGNLLFGFATSLPLAIACRALLLGAGNGWMTVMGPICLEVGRKERQAAVFGTVLGGGTAISVFSPSVAAFLYKTIPTFPALAPGMVGCAVGVFTALVTYLWTPLDAETSPAAAAAPAPAVPSLGIAIAPAEADDDAVRLELHSESTAASCLVGEVHSQPNVEADSERERAVEPTVLEAPSGEAVGAAPSGSLGGSTVSETAPIGTDSGAAPRPRASWRAWEALATPPFPLITLLRALSGWIMFAAFDLFPLWMIGSKRAGGLALKKERLGMCLSAATLGIWAFCTFLQGRTIGRLGYRKTFVLGAVVAALFFAVIPYSASAYVATPLISCVYIGIVMTQGGIIGIANLEAAKYPDVKGTINGIVVTFEALAKALGPLIAGPLIAFGLSNRLVPLVISFFAICSLLICLLALRLTSATRVAKADVTQERAASE